MSNLRFKKKSKLVLSIGIIIIFIASLICIKAFFINYGEDYFIQYTSYVAVPQNSNYKLDLGYFIKIGRRDILSKKAISSVSFVNSRLTKINSTNFIKGSTTKKYNIKTLSLDVSFLSTGTEDVDHIQIMFADGTKKTYPIGKWRFTVSNIPESNFIETSSYFPIACSNLNSYLMKFKNNSNKTLIVNNLILDISGISNNFEDFSVSKYEQVDKSFTIKFNNGNSTSQSIYYLKPRIEYLLDNKIYAYYPPGTYYGIFNLNDKIIDQEVAKSQSAK